MIPPLRTFRDGPTMWHDWAIAELLDRRTVLLTGELDQDRATSVAAELMLLDGSGDEPVDLRIDCTGGSLDAALMLVDVVDLLGVPVHARCTGRVHGAAAFLFVVAPKRIMTPHAQLRLEEPSVAFAGPASDVVAAAAQHRARVEDLFARVAAATGRSLDDVRDDVEHRRTFDADDAVASGYADEVARPEADIRPFPRTVGYRNR